MASNTTGDMQETNWGYSRWQVKLALVLETIFTLRYTAKHPNDSEVCLICYFSCEEVHELHCGLVS